MSASPAPRPSLSATTWAAIALHLAVALAIARVRVDPRVPAPSTPPADEAIDLDLAAVPSPAPPAEPAQPAAAAKAPRPVGAIVTASRELPGTAGTDEPPSPGAATTGPAEPAAEPGAATSPVLLVKPGFGVTAATANPFLGPPPSGASGDRSELAEAKERADQMLRQPARERELELGLGPDGPVRIALADAAAEGTTDVSGKAVFRAVADGSGAVLSVTLLSCDGGHAGWSDAARAALAKLRGTKLRLPSTAKRAEVTVEVTSAWKLPSGHDPGVDVDLFHIPIKKGSEGKNGTKVSLLDPIPKIRTVELSKDVKIPIPQVEITIIQTNVDPADVGARPRRIVHTRLVESKVL